MKENPKDVLKKLKVYESILEKLHKHALNHMESSTPNEVIWANIQKGYNSLDPRWKKK